MKNEPPKPIKYSVINIGNKYQAKAYYYLAKSIYHLASMGQKRPFGLLVTYKELPDESHSAHAHKEHALFNPDLNYIQDGFIFKSHKRIAIQVIDCIPIYDSEILIDWRNSNGLYKWEKAVFLALGVVESIADYAITAQDYNDYIHLGYTTLKTPCPDSPCIGVDGCLFNVITHTLRADARTYKIPGQDSIAFHLRAIKKLKKALDSSINKDGAPT